MKYLIVNADDCGKNDIVDKAIENCIINNEITSTTIMANMDDFEGACKLYNKYKGKISFGVHLNLTEGKPLTSPEDLVACGIAEVKDDGSVEFCGNKIRKHHFNKKERIIIYNELAAQIQKILDSGIKISHIDSHHHIHTDFWVLLVVIKISKAFKINKIRSISNYNYHGTSFFARQIWLILLHIAYPSVKTVKWFTSYAGFVEVGPSRIKDKQILELMTHPGGYEPEEAAILSDKRKVQDFCKISYNDL